MSTRQVLRLGISIWCLFVVAALVAAPNQHGRLSGSQALVIVALVGIVAAAAVWRWLPARRTTRTAYALLVGAATLVGVLLLHEAMRNSCRIGGDAISPHPHAALLYGLAAATPIYAVCTTLLPRRRARWLLPVGIVLAALAGRALAAHMVGGATGCDWDI